MTNSTFEMDNEQLFNKKYTELKNQLNLLDDKPEETPFSTMKALWFKAAGVPISAEKAIDLPLPDLTETQNNFLSELIQMRVEKTPLAYITGRQNYMGIELIADKRALIPRKETEILSKTALELSKNNPDKNKNTYVMDVCCGSGNVGISVAYYNPDCIVLASDISYEAVELAQENINLLNLNKRIQVKQGNLMAVFENKEYFEKFDIIVCNPPYIFSSKVPKMDLEISSNEPRVAFDGGMLGIEIIQRLIHEAPMFLKNKGWLVFEVGLGQGQFITQLCKRTQLFNKVENVKNESNQIRVIKAQK